MGLIAVTSKGGTVPFLFSINSEPFMSQQQFPRPGGWRHDIRAGCGGCEYSIGVLLARRGNDVPARLGDDLDPNFGDVVTLQALTNLVSKRSWTLSGLIPWILSPCLDEDCLSKSSDERICFDHSYGDGFKWLPRLR